MLDSSYSFTLGTRLKALRTEKGLSHETLSNALKEKYQISISTDSLQNYEVSEPNHSKSRKNLGMRIEYLRAFADYYGVSTDYLLGISEYRTADPKIKEAAQLTGLSEDTIAFFAKYSHITSHISCIEWLTDVIDVLIDDCQFSLFGRKMIKPSGSVLQLIFYYLFYNGATHEKKKIDIHGNIFEYVDKAGVTHLSTERNVFHEITFDDIVVQNAALAEIQQALRKIKESVYKTSETEVSDGHD